MRHIWWLYLLALIVLSHLEEGKTKEYVTVVPSVDPIVREWI